MTWTTGNEAVATVADGVVTAVGAGSTVITATCGSVKAECTVTVTASPLTVSVGGKTSPLSRVGGEGETKYRAALPYGSDVTIHVADASFLLVTDKKSNYLNDAGANPFTLKAAELETALLTDKDEKPFTPAENSKVAYLSIMDVMAGTTYELYLELTREVTPATRRDAGPDGADADGGKDCFPEGHGPAGEHDGYHCLELLEGRGRNGWKTGSLRRRRPARLSSLRRAAP